MSAANVLAVDECDGGFVVAFEVRGPGFDLELQARAVTVKGAVDMEQQVLSASGLDAIVLRYGLLYGPGTWREASSGPKPALHVDAAAHAALLAITRGAAGVYNIADEDGAVSIAKARAELGFDPRFRGP